MKASPRVARPFGALAALLASASPAAAQMQWRSITNGPHGALGYDAARQRLLSVAPAGVREWDGVTWTEIAAANPASSGTWVHHDVLGVPLLLASTQTAYAWNGATWSSLALGPGPLAGGLFAYDSVRNEIVLFGGSSGNQTWTWQGSWTQRTPSSPPPAMSERAMAFDRVQGRLVLHGGFNGSYSGITYGWDGAQWSVLTTSGPPRSRHSMAFDGRLGAVVMCGGSDSNGWAGSQVSMFQSGSWSSIGGPMPSRNAPVLVFHGARNELLLWGGSVNDYLGSGVSSAVPELWSLGANGWTNLGATRPWPHRFGYALATDPVRRSVLLLGGGAGSLPGGWGDCWEWDGHTWSGGGFTTLAGTANPAMAYDEARQQMIALAGDGPGAWRTFVRNGSVWSFAPLGPMPSIRRGIAMAYDGARQVVVAFGGRDFVNPLLDDTWEWNGSTWTQRAPAVSPSPRSHAVAAYDPQQQRVMLHGGQGLFATFADTWSWDGTSWQRIAAAGPAGSGMAYDPLRQRMVLTGAATWEWVGGSWVQRVAANANGWPIAFDPSLGGTVALDLNGNDPFRLYAATVPATALPFGAGCAGTAGLPVLAATELPWLGATLRLTVNAVPANGFAALVLGLSNTAWLGVPLPLPLGAIGMPGCELLVSMDDAVLGMPSGGGASWQIAVPDQTALLGFDLFAQAAVLSPGTNTFGWVASNGIAASIGER